jgi:hypothetical protein
VAVPVVVAGAYRIEVTCRAVATAARGTTVDAGRGPGLPELPATGGRADLGVALLLLLGAAGAAAGTRAVSRRG